jgi:hypothetical protein
MNDIKQLHVQLSKLEADYAAKQTIVAQGQQELSFKSKQIIALKEKINQISQKREIVLSDHALIRYVERVLGVDLDAAKAAIITDELRKMVDTLGGNGSYPMTGFIVKMKDSVITTVIKD